MKFHSFLCHLPKTSYLNRQITFLDQLRIQSLPKKRYLKKLISDDGLLRKFSFSSPSLKRFNHDDHELEEHGDDTKQINEVYEEIYEQPFTVRHILYPKMKDEIMKRINDCASTEEALEAIRKFQAEMRSDHLTQAVVTFWDLQKMYHHVNILSGNSHVNETVFDKMNHDYVQMICENADFKGFLEVIDRRRSEFDSEQLSYVILCLNKMGCDVKSEMFQNLIFEFNRKFSHSIDKFNLAVLARFMTSLFKQNDLSFYYVIQRYIPLLQKHIGKVESAEEMRCLTKCLCTINLLINKDSLLKYKTKIYELIITGILNYSEYKSLIRVMNFLSYPQWRQENSRIVCDCLKLLKNHLHLLNINEILTIYDIFSKLQEPGDILSELQRCATKYSLQLKEELSPLLDIRLKLFSCTIYFTSPAQRPHFDKTIRKFIDFNLDVSSVLELRKIMIFTKTNDANLCKSFWGKILLYLDDETFAQTNLLKISNAYINFEEITNTFRHVQCENKLLQLLEIELENGFSGVTPSHFSSIASFILIYSHKRKLIDTVIDRIEEFRNRFNSIDCLNISQSLEYAKSDNKLLSSEDIKRVTEAMDFATENLQKMADPSESVLLLKAALCRKNIQNYTPLWEKFDENLSSKLVHGIAYCLYSSRMLIPKIMDLLTNYVVENGNSLLGYNVERVLFLCYHLGYAPKHSQKFFDNIINVLIRDQERMSGLSYLQSCLALAYYNALPLSFIKQIFNEEFLEKLDVELENCYFKDVYPLRVRQCMMRLNRVICLDYPEQNVPWFHQKYVEQHKSKEANTKNLTMTFQTITDSFLQMANYKNIIQRNVTLPYGYRADFVVNLDNNNKLCSEEDSTQKVAVLLFRSGAYTRGHVQYKGSTQTKIRHLEMLGFKVAVVKVNEWNGLIYGQDRIEYLNEILHLKYVDLDINDLKNSCNRQMNVRKVIVENMKYLKFSNGKSMPALGLGTWQATEIEMEKAVDKALGIGYRHFDTALLYENEKPIGKVLNNCIKSGKVPRDELFITTKLPPVGMYADKVDYYFKKSLNNLNLNYVDLYLIHCPMGIKNIPENKDELEMDENVDHISVWKEMEKLNQLGLTKSIGISNFTKNQIINILNNCKIRPACLQMELHLYQQQKDLVAFCEKENIKVVAYSPLGSPGLKTYYEENNRKIEIPNLFENESVKKLAAKYEKTPAQILLRHAIDKGIGAIPKSSNEQRLRQNFEIFDFELEKNDILVLNGLDMGKKGHLAEWEPWTWLVSTHDFKIFTIIESSMSKTLKPSFSY